MNYQPSYKHKLLTLQAKTALGYEEVESNRDGSHECG